VAFLLKMPGLRHIDEEHTKKTNVDILERRLVQVRCGCGYAGVGLEVGMWG